ncbi:MAG: FeoB-associated Cys-rich membrane protein [Prevotella sp.]|nr:FeoB-associated Cys-rich membrane protein [Prevotella sp.]
MILQYIIVGVIVVACLALGARYFYREVRENLRYRRQGCAGCPFYEKCQRDKKQTEH